MSFISGIGRCQDDETLIETIILSGNIVPGSLEFAWWQAGFLARQRL